MENVRFLTSLPARINYLPAEKKALLFTLYSQAYETFSDKNMFPSNIFSVLDRFYHSQGTIKA
jgi:hypothetical protein